MPNKQSPQKVRTIFKSRNRNWWLTQSNRLSRPSAIHRHGRPRPREIDDDSADNICAPQFKFEKECSWFWFHAVGVAPITRFENAGWDPKVSRRPALQPELHRAF